MHELAVTKNILDIAIKHAYASKAKRVTKLNLVVGQLSSFVDDSIQFYWDMVAANTIAEGAQLEFRRIKTEFSCLDCHCIFTPGPDSFDCPKCGSVKIRITAGEEFYLDSIEIEN